MKKLFDPTLLTVSTKIEVTLEPLPLIARVARALTKREKKKTKWLLCPVSPK
jgi:hypothetical protein